MNHTMLAVDKQILKNFIPPVFLPIYRRLRGVNQTEQLPEMAIEDLFPGIEGVTVTVPFWQTKRQSGTLPIAELLVVSAICQHLSAMKVFEIGTYTGSSTLAIAMHTSPDAQVFTIDLPPQARRTKHPVENGDITGVDYVVGEHYRSNGYERKIKQLYGDSAEFDFGSFAASMDIVFVDGNHEYENVKADTVNAFKMVRPGGVIIWDDYHPQFGPGVMRALHELPRGTIYRIKDTRLALHGWHR